MRFEEGMTAQPKVLAQSALAVMGGLADVAGALPRALARRGNQVAVVMPFYNSVRRSGRPIEKTGIVTSSRSGATTRRRQKSSKVGCRPIS